MLLCIPHVIYQEYIFHCLTLPSYACRQQTYFTISCKYKLHTDVSSNELPLSSSLCRVSVCAVFGYNSWSMMRVNNESKNEGKMRLVEINHGYWLALKNNTKCRDEAISLGADVTNACKHHGHQRRHSQNWSRAMTNIRQQQRGRSTINIAHAPAQHLTTEAVDNCYDKDIQAVPLGWAFQHNSLRTCERLL